MRLLAPAYGYPASAARMWSSLASAADSIGHVIINPGSGPGQVRDPEWVAQIGLLEDLGIPLLGYMDLDYANKPLGALVREAEVWRRWYGIVSFFLDCAPSSDVLHTGDVADVLRTSARARHLTANAGTRTTPEVAMHFDAVVEHEGLPWAAFPDDAASAGGPGRSRSDAGRAWIVHGADRAAARRTLDEARRSGVGAVWITDLSGANPYRDLPTYWDWLLQEVRSPGA